MTESTAGLPILPGRHDLLTVEELCALVKYDQTCSFKHGEDVVGAVATHRARLRDRALGLAHVIIKAEKKKK